MRNSCMKIVIGLLLSAALLIIPAFGQTSFKGCPAQGRRNKSKSNPKGTVPTREQGLNVRKNRGTAPPVSNIDNKITLASLIKAKEETSLDFKKAVTVTAFVADVKDGEPGESCNCGRDDLKDIHIAVVANEADRANSKKHVIFEITPRFESKLGSFAEVRDQIEGKWVQFTGWLTYDYKHRANASNRRKKGNIWRVTAWEVHPVTSFEIVGPPQ